MNPLISCICPTANRPRHLHRLLEVFKKQVYEPLELRILDDGTSSSFTWKEMMALPGNVFYDYTSEKKSIPAKFNILCRESRGELIAHFDDDDWYSPYKLTDQYQLITFDPKIKLVGFNEIIFYCEIKKQFYKWKVNARHITGSSFLYYKTLWQERGFDESRKLGADRIFASDHKSVMKSQPGNFKLIAHHHLQSSHKRSFQFGYEAVSYEKIPNEFFESLAILHEAKCTV